MPDPTPDTTNRFLVSATGDKVAVLGLVKLAGPISREDALNLAAWLVALADPSPGHADFKAVLAAVEGT